MSDFKLVKLLDGITINLDTTGVLNNFAATSAPTVNDDSGDSYSVGSHWVNTTTDIVYVCTDSTVGAANWAPVSGATTDNDAIHDNVAGEIAAVTTKVTPIAADYILLEDSAAANAKKKATLGSLPLILGWIDYATNWDTAPTVNEVITGGTVYNYTWNSVTRYRFVPSTYDASLDAFYENYNSGTDTLTNLIVARGF